MLHKDYYRQGIVGEEEKSVVVPLKGLNTKKN
jgi:hypothetical protein